MIADDAIIKKISSKWFLLHKLIEKKLHVNVLNAKCKHNVDQNVKQQHYQR